MLGGSLASDRAPLLVGVITTPGTMRNNSAASEAADAEFRAKRKTHLQRTQYRCAFCGLASEWNEVHHLDGNHANNDMPNFATACYLCHGYHHLGQRALGMGVAGKGQGEPIGLALIPEIAAADLNLLIMAAGAAMADPQEGPTARLVLKELFSSAGRADAVGRAYAVDPAAAAADMAAALAQLAKKSPQDYEDRAQAVAGLRIVPHAKTVLALGERFLNEFKSMPVKDWLQVFNGISQRIGAF